MKKLVNEFKEFIMRGNVLDMAVGVIIATAFGKITTSLVNDIFMPFIGWIFGARDMTALNVIVRPEEVAADGTVVKEAITLGFGTFVGTVIDFILVALVVFLIVKGFNAARTKAESLKKKEEEAAPAPEEPAKPTTEELLADILAEMKKNNK